MAPYFVCAGSAVYITLNYKLAVMQYPVYVSTLKGCKLCVNARVLYSQLEQREAAATRESSACDMHCFVTTRTISAAGAAEDGSGLLAK